MDLKKRRQTEQETDRETERKREREREERRAKESVEEINYPGRCEYLFQLIGAFSRQNGKWNETKAKGRKVNARLERRNAKPLFSVAPLRPATTADVIYIMDD